MIQRYGSNAGMEAAERADEQARQPLVKLGGATGFRQ
jgi:hypothetical protein